MAWLKITNKKDEPVVAVTFPAAIFGGEELVLELCCLGLGGNLG